MILATTTMFGMAAVAEDRLVVVELFTSQGCSSCPPADAILSDLAKMQGVLPLALHVDYWDYIGWEDSFAQPAFTARQESYARVAGANAIYTPQMLVGGVDAVIGAHGMQVMEQISRHAALPVTVSLQLERGPQTLRIAAEGTVTRPVLVQLVRFMPEAEVEVHRGENAGHRLRSTNIVTSWDVLMVWDGSAPLLIEVDLSGPEPAAVILQEEGPGLVLAAARAD
jgi:hypothetical protein